MSHDERDYAYAVVVVLVVPSLCQPLGEAVRS